MNDIVRETSAMISGMSPEVQPGIFVFGGPDDPAAQADCARRALAMFAEAEGPSFILPMAAAREMGFDVSLPMRQITLKVHSALDGVGLTAAVATALAGAGIPCNMVAALRHDHVFVPADRAEQAMAVLTALQAKGA